MKTILAPLVAALAAAIILVLAASPALAQDLGADELESSGGTHFIVAFPDTTMNTFDARYPNRAYVDKAILFIYSAVDARVSVKGRGYSTTMQTTGGKFSIVELMGGQSQSAAAPIVTQQCQPVDNTFRIESSEPIVVVQYLVTKFGTEAWTPLPVDAWGTEYHAAAMPGEIGSNVTPGGEFDYNRQNKMFPAEILVIAAYDDTRITIVPNGQVYTDCGTSDIVLKAGEAYLVQSHVDTLTTDVGVSQPDFGGSRIVATKPVGVITGNTRAQLVDPGVGLGRNIFKNMQVEWLTPVEQWGTEFVYMPTWDSRRPTGAPAEDPAEKRVAEFVRVYGQSEAPTTGYFMQSGVPIPYDAAIGRAGFAETRHTPNLARVHRTDKPAQAMMQSAAVVKYAGTTNGFGSYIGAAYDGWGGYMATLTPREQWVSFAPYYASSHPGGMEHFINVVTDSAHRNDIYLKSGARFEFNRGAIEGTDLIWGTMSVAPGVDNVLEGRNGARFGGYVYGGLTKGGHEEYRPGRIRGEEEPPAGVGGGKDSESQPLHPSEYEEYLAVAYGHPLLASRNIVGAGDSLGIRTSSDCSGTCVDIESLNRDAVGLRSIRLDRSINAKIGSQTPEVITGAVDARICVVPINRQQDASAEIVIRDRSGRLTRLPFVYWAERLYADAERLHFGTMTPGTPAEQSVTVTNPLGRPTVIESAGLVVRTQGFTLVEPTSFPVTIAPGGTLRLTVRAMPAAPDQSYVDTLLIELPCPDLRLPVLAETSDPCVNVHDLDFGTMEVGQSANGMLRISNDGGGEVRFNNPTGGALITWLNDMFEVAQSELDKLTNLVLRRGDYVDILVTFRAREVGDFTDSARVWASVRKCRDVSVWTVRVTAPTVVPTGTGASFALESAQPNPATSTTTIGFSLERPAHATLTLYDERGGRVMTLVDEPRAAGAHAVTLDVASLPAGIYHYRLSAGGASLTHSLVRR